MKRRIYAVKDHWHPHINGDKAPEVRSDNPAFGSLRDFKDWVTQHNGYSEIYPIEEKK